MSHGCFLAVAGVSTKFLEVAKFRTTKQSEVHHPQTNSSLVRLSLFFRLSSPVHSPAMPPTFSRYQSALLTRFRPMSDVFPSLLYFVSSLSFTKSVLSLSSPFFHLKRLHSAFYPLPYPLPNPRARPLRIRPMRRNIFDNGRLTFFPVLSNACICILFTYRNHMDGHERPYICSQPACAHKKGYTRMRTLLRHERDEHGIGKFLPLPAFRSFFSFIASPARSNAPPVARLPRWRQRPNKTSPGEM